MYRNQYYLFMKKNAIYLFLSTLFLFSSLLLTAQSEKKPEPLTKETFKQKVWNFEDSQEFKYLGDKPCLIDFHADWCGWCKRIAPALEELCNTYVGQVYFYKIDTERQKELQALFQVKSLPTILYIPMKGQPTLMPGARSKEQFDQYIQQYLLGK